MNKVSQINENKWVEVNLDDRPGKIQIIKDKLFKGSEGRTSKLKVACVLSAASIVGLPLSIFLLGCIELRTYRSHQATYEYTLKTANDSQCDLTFDLANKQLRYKVTGSKEVSEGTLSLEREGDSYAIQGVLKGQLRQVISAQTKLICCYSLVFDPAEQTIQVDDNVVLESQSKILFLHRGLNTIMSHNETSFEIVETSSANVKEELEKFGTAYDFDIDDE